MKIWRKFLNKKSKGFTLIELLLVAAIITILSAVILPISSTVFTQNNLDTSAHNLESYLNRAYTYAREGKYDSDWGVNIGQQTGIVTFFAGSSLDINNPNGLNETFNISPNITLDSSLTDVNDNPSGFIQDPDFTIVFTKGSGIPSSSFVWGAPVTTFFINLTSQQGIIKTISINKIGSVNLSTSYSYILEYLASPHGSISGITPQKVPYGASGSAVTAVPDTDYVFVSWSDGSTQNPRTDSNVTHNISATANFVPAFYTLTYTAGAHGSISGTTPQTVAYRADGDTITAVPNTNYHFVNWSDGSTSNPRTDTTIVANISVTANFAQNHYIYYFSNGSTSGTSPVDSNTYAPGDVITVRDNTGNLTKTGFVFAGWQTSPSGGTLYIPGSTLSMSSSNIILYARWSLLHVNYMSTNSTSGTAPIDSNSYAPGDTVTVLDNTGNLTKTGYAFGGWNTNSVGSGTNYAPNSTFSMGYVNLTLYPKWLHIYTITYIGNNNTSGTPPVDSNSYLNGDLATMLDNTGNLARTGYVFSGWNTNPSGTGLSFLPSSTYPVAGSNYNITLYAKWVHIYTITYNGNNNTGGTTPTDSNNYISGDTVTVLDNTGNLTRTGYVFVGWSGNSGGSGTDFLAGSTFTVFGITYNITLYAKWAVTHTVTYNGNSNDTGSVPIDSNSYIPGSTVTVLNNSGNLTKNGYVFSSWNTNSVGSGTNYAPNSTFSMGSSNVILYAKWTHVYTLTYAAGTHGSVSGSSPQIIVSGSNGSAVTAVPDTNYHFVNWSNDNSTQNPRTDTNVQGNISVTANFAINTYTLTYTAGTNGSLTGSSPQTVNYGADGSAVTAVPATGYHFVNWSNDNSTQNPRTDTNITHDISVTANFAINTYTLTYTAGTHGSISGSSPQTINYGANGSAVTPIPSAGYHFVNWSNDNSTQNPRTDTNVQGNISVTANFAINTYTLTYTAGTHGSISGSSPQTINYGADGSAVTAVPATGYHFVNWSDASVSNPRTDTNVVANISVTANFSNNYTLTYTAGTGGTITGTTPQTVITGSNGSAVTATPSTGYHFVNWSDASTTNPRTDTNVQGNLSFTANFALDWQPVGAAGFTSNAILNPKIVMDSNNVPYIGYEDNTTKKMNVKKFDGSSWVTVGSADFSPGTIQWPYISLDHNNVPYVVFSDEANGGKIMVMKFDGNSWVTVGNAGFSLGGLWRGSLAFNSSNVPYVAFSDAGTSPVLYKERVMKLSGSTWVDVGAVGFSTGDQGTDYSSLLFGSDNIPYLTYDDEYSTGIARRSTMMKFNGSSWVSIGTQGFTGVTISNTFLALDSNNLPYVSYYGGTGGNVIKWNGSAWVAVGSTLTGGSYLEVHLNSSNVPYVAYINTVSSPWKLNVKKFNGSSWVDVGAIITSNQYGSSLALDSTGVPYVLITDGLNSSKASVVKYVSP